MLQSRLRTARDPWETAPEYRQTSSITGERFLQVTNLLLENPNLNSTHLFRADILLDSEHQLKTVAQKEKQCQVENLDDVGYEAAKPYEALPLNDAANALPNALPNEPSIVQGAILQRRVLRRLIPRKPQLDRPLDQWCYLYQLAGDSDDSGYVVLYVPQAESEADMPWYHPPVKSLAYVYEHNESESTLSVHLLRFSKSSDALPPRLHRTFISLLHTIVRLARNPVPINTADTEQQNEQTLAALSLAPSALKDTILPQHIVQDTYTRLKQRYAADLISRWVEQTEPSKHVFEDLSIAAFLIELWEQMYPPGTFPGFIDFACGNGVLTYILIKEGFRGRGFDARRRSTWKVLEMDDYLDEMVCIPQPFLDHAPTELNVNRLHESGMKVHNGLFNGVFNGLPNGLFKPGTFIISNHADELTPWTPILAALAAPDSSLPFLAIPCCSHALSGAKHRYSRKEIVSADTASHTNGTEEQPLAGDLRTLRAAKIKAANHQDDKSMYACLTKKVVALAQEVGCETELTLMRIPSTRNIGVVGNRRRTVAAVNASFLARNSAQSSELEANTPISTSADEDVVEKIEQLLIRECAMSGGMTEAARIWIERAQKLQKGQGRGKVNLKGKPGMKAENS